MRDLLWQLSWPLLRLGLLGAALVGAGCSSKNEDPVDAGDDGLAFATCLESHASKGVMPYMPGVMTASSGGGFMATLVTSQPGYPQDDKPSGPEVKGTNTWSVRITDTGGTPVDGLAVDASPYMPDHRHGTSVTPVTTAEGSGGYVISPLYLYMTGYWEVTLNIQAPASDGGAAPAPDSALFTVCIP